MSDKYVDPSCLITIVKGDITLQPVDVIVNAAKESLLGGGGVDGAIHRTAGPELLAHCENLHGCPTGDVVVTPSFDLEEVGIKNIYHTVGPMYENHPPAVARTLLRRCYLNALDRASIPGHLRPRDEVTPTAIAFPAISTGIYGYPIEEATELALTIAWRYCRYDRPHAEKLREIRFVVFDTDTLELYTSTLARILDESGRF